MRPHDASKLQSEIFRRMTAAERIDCALRWTEGTYEIMRATIRTQHADWSREQIEREIGRRITGIDVTKLDWSRCVVPPAADQPPMVVPDELRMIVTALEKSGLRYAITGSLASIAWGTPRATYDADVLVALRPADVPTLQRSFPPPDWYLDPSAVHEALATGGEFNAIQGTTGTKIDFWVHGGRPANLVRLARRRRDTIAGVECWLLSPEDTILAKLEWMQAAPSDRQQQDVVGILRAQQALLDVEYLREWANRLGVRKLLDDAVSGGWGPLTGGES